MKVKNKIILYFVISVTVSCNYSKFLKKNYVVNNSIGDSRLIIESTDSSFVWIRKNQINNDTITGTYLINKNKLIFNTKNQTIVETIKSEERKISLFEKKTQQPVFYANIKLYNCDSVLTSEGYSDINGNYICPTNIDVCYLKISYLNFISKPITCHHQLGFKNYLIYFNHNEIQLKNSEWKIKKNMIVSPFKETYIVVK